MIVKPYAARNLLIEALAELGLVDIQLSEAAVFRLAQALEGYGMDVAKMALEQFLEENDKRQQLRIRKLRRLGDEQIEEALNGHA